MRRRAAAAAVGAAVGVKLRRTQMNRTMMLAACAVAAAAFSAKGDFAMDRSVMSDKYWAIWNDEVQAKIDADIEKYRKADATVEVAAPDGAEVKVEQVGHAFYFGAHIFKTSSGRRSGTTATRSSTARSSTPRPSRSIGARSSSIRTPCVSRSATRTPRSTGTASTSATRRLSRTSRIGVAPRPIR